MNFCQLFSLYLYFGLPNTFFMGIEEKIFPSENAIRHMRQVHLPLDEAPWHHYKGLEK